jgi:hypothetical protein
MLSGFVLLGACTEIDDIPAAAANANGVGGIGAAGTSAASAGAAGHAGSAGGANMRAGNAAPPARGGAGDLGTPMGPVDGVAMIGTACTQDPGKACAARGSLTPLVCTAGRWTAGPTCAPSERCDTSSGMTQGTCQPMLLLCAGRQTGEEVCDGYRRRRCGADLLRFDASECPENSHCEAGSPVKCVCDVGHKLDAAGACVSNVECPAAACLPGGHCVVGESDYSCECEVEYEGTGTKACVATGRCAQGSVCTGEYACRSRDMTYVCRGQFADWPMPSSIAGAKAAPNYMPTPDTVVDAVTKLTWQRNLPETYIGCTTGCSWQKAKAYCEQLELAGMSDWRLPTLIELVSILDDNRVMPSIDPDNFPNTPPELFWTASSSAAGADQAWALDFNVFQSNTVPKTNSQRVRCVR